MEPIAAFALASNVIAVVDTAIRTASLCHKFYKGGKARPELLNISKDFLEASTALQGSIQEYGVAGPVQKNDQAIYDLSVKCAVAAAQLASELEKLDVHGEGARRVFVAIGRTVKAVLKARSIDELKDDFESYRRALDTRILIDLRVRYRDVEVQQLEGFANLSASVQKLVTDLEKELRDISNVIVRELTTSRQQLTAEISSVRDVFENVSHRKRVLESLYFREMESREEEIRPAHKRTFEWIFSAPNKALGPWDNFQTWLEKDGGLYWVSGKAGSGKSTLMHFVHNHEQTKDVLNGWAASHKLVTPSVFLWSPAIQTLQKSFVGLLRAILFQVLDACKWLIPLVVDPERDWLPAWTEPRLRATLEKALKQASSSTRFCIFLDALDELDGVHDELVEWVESVARLEGVKICVASRPWIEFRTAFRKSPQLKLQDLTARDIRRVVVDKLHKKTLPDRFDPLSDVEIDKLASTIVQRAEGIFLWVTLAVTSVIDGIRKQDPYDQLTSKVEVLPTKISELYCHLLASIPEEYKCEAARYFRLSLASREELSPLSIWLTDLDLKHQKRGPERRECTLAEMIKGCHIAADRVSTICAGLLEIGSGTPSYLENSDLTIESDSGSPYSVPSDVEMTSPDGSSNDQDTDSESSSSSTSKLTKDWPSEEKELYELHRDSHLRFLHRSLHDFLAQAEDLLSEMESGRSRGWNASRALAETQMMMMEVVPWVLDLRSPLSTGSSLEEFRFAMWYARAAEQETGQAQDVFISDLVSKVSSLLSDITDPKKPHRLHWSTLLSNGMTMWPNIAVDPLGLSLEWGFQHFHFNVVDTPQDKLDYLLACTGTFNLSGYTNLHSVRMRPVRMGRARFLLQAGANPNARGPYVVPGRYRRVEEVGADSTTVSPYEEPGEEWTPWKHFISNVRLFEGGWTESCDTVEIFLQCGADVNAMLQFPMDIPFVQSGTSSFWRVDIIVKMTALSFSIEYAPAEQQRFQSILERFGAKAGVFLHVLRACQDLPGLSCVRIDVSFEFQDIGGILDHFQRAAGYARHRYSPSMDSEGARGVMAAVKAAVNRAIANHLNASASLEDNDEEAAV